MSQSDENWMQYQLVFSRRAAMDSLMWQVPVLSLTGQAFLFSIALGADTSEFARSIAAFLAFVASIASIQLMSKHRHLEVRDSVWLENFEKEHGLLILHSKPNRPEGNFFKKHFVGISSYKVWAITLALFGLGALIILLVPASCFA